MRLQYSEFKEQTEDYLDNFSGIVNFNVELQKLNERLISLGRYHLSDVPTFSASTKEQELLYALIKNRYITLDYLNIINHYYGDSSTQTFMRKLYTASDDFDINLKLNDIPGLFEQLEEEDFEQVQVLNIDLAVWLQIHHYDKFNKVLLTAKHSDTGFLEQLIDYDDKFYKIITNLLEEIKFDLSILSSIHRYIIAFDIAVNNRYEKSQVNIELITNHLKKNIKLADYINLLNSQNVFFELKKFLIQNVQDSLPINKISEVSENLTDMIIEQGGFRLTSSNINYYIEKKSFNRLLENFLDGHQIEFDDQLTEKSFFSTLSDTSLSEKTFKDIWITYDGEKIAAQAISQLPNNLILVLLRLGHLNVDSDLLNLLVDKNVNMEIDFFTHSIKQKFLEYQVVMNDNLLKTALTLPDDINHDLFSYNINSLAVSDVKNYLEMNHLSDGKFIKIMKHKQGYQNILLDNNFINDRILNWMKDNDFISDVKVVNDKLKPLYF